MGLAALALLGGGTDGSDLGHIRVDRDRVVGAASLLPYGGLAALAQEAPRPTHVLPSVPLTRKHGEATAREGSIPALIAAYPWPVREALAVARCENRNPNAAPSTTFVSITSSSSHQGQRHQARQG